MAAPKLPIYNLALGHLGERRLATENENREPRRVLDDNWPYVVKHCLEQGNWKFALRNIRFTPSSTPSVFGFANAFAKPTDVVRVARISDRADLEIPLLRYKDDRDYWYADADFIYVEYVSDGSATPDNFGNELSGWTGLFADYVAARLALVSCSRLRGDEPGDLDQKKVHRLKSIEAEALYNAQEHNDRSDAPRMDVIAHCLEKAPWKFALRTAELDPSNTVTPDFGFTHAFAKPTDWVRTSIISENECFEPPLVRFSEENGHWYADGEKLFVRYVSNDDNYGLNQSRWPQTFKDYVATRAALLTYQGKADATAAMVDKLERMEKKALGAARDHDALGTPPQFSPTGTWVRSRGGNSGSRWDRQTF